MHRNVCNSMDLIYMLRPIVVKSLQMFHFSLVTPQLLELFATFARRVKGWTLNAT